MKPKCISIFTSAATLFAIRNALASSPPTVTILHYFGDSHLQDPAATGSYPSGSLVMDAGGNIFGTTGGTSPNHFGSIYELSGPAYSTFSTLQSFGDFSGSPRSGFVSDAGGNYYGTMQANLGSFGAIFESPAADHRIFNVVATFDASNGAEPESPLTFDTQGNLYGTTLDDIGPGTVFELSATTKQITTLAQIPGNKNYGNFGFTAGVTLDAAGNLYGVTSYGGAFGYGSVYELSGPNHQTFTTLVNFNGSNGAYPVAQLTIDSAGNIFGTTAQGGNLSGGTVFQLPASNHGQLNTLCSFAQNYISATTPLGGITVDAAGDLFGTTSISVFELSGSGYQTFTNTPIIFNYDPDNTMMADSSGNLFGTMYGLPGSFYGPVGAVFEITNSGFVVPEPTGLSILAIGGLALLRRRRAALPDNLRSC